MDTHLILQQAGRRPGSRCCELCSVAQMLSNLHGASRADDRQMDTATGCLTIRVGYSLQCRVPIHSTVNKQGAPVKNNPLRKIYISRNVVDFFHQICTADGRRLKPQIQRVSLPYSV